MRRRALDTSILIKYWGDRRKGLPHAEITEQDARGRAQELGRLQASRAILTPIYVEYIAGQQSARAVDLARVYLGEFETVDRGHVTEEDWVNAIRIADRVPPDGSRRQLGDCLIRAICKRLRLEIATHDRRFPF